MTGNRSGENNPFFGRKHTEESKEKNRKAHLGNKTWLGKRHSEKTRELFSKLRKGRKLTEEWKKNLSKSVPSGVDSPHWKRKPTYAAIHHWVRKYKGKLEKCEKCGKTKDETKLHWANKDHKYKRNLEDWQNLCASCHRKYDKSKGFWHKGTTAKTEYDSLIFK